MIRKLTPFALALVAALALASPASAEFTSGSATTTYTAAALENQVFTTNSGSVKVTCTAIGFDHTGTTTKNEESITVEPTYGGCTISLAKIGTFEALVDTNECHFLLTTVEAEALHILCPAGKQIELTAKILGAYRKCVDVHAQTPTHPVLVYTNGTNAATGKMDFEVRPVVFGITYEKTGSCAIETIEANDLEYFGNFTVTGHDTKTDEAVDVTKDVK